MLYTRKGDDGTTKAFNSKAGQRMSKSSCQTESLGALDELNSFLGIVKVRTTDVSWSVPHGATDKHPAEIVGWIQHCLFTVQAGVAGAGTTISPEKVSEAEALTDAIEKEMPPITTFFVSGGTELAALFDVSRTLARKAERRVVAAVEEKEVSVSVETLAFLNRLSSLLYALARLTNHLSGIKEEAPLYQ